MQFLPISMMSCLFSIVFDDDIVDIEKSNIICSPVFVVDDFFGIFSHRGKVKHELRVPIHELRVQIYELRVQIHELRVQIHELED